MPKIVITIFFLLISFRYIQNCQAKFNFSVSKPLAKVFLFVNQKNINERVYCSATMLKNNGTCALITNAHCISDTYNDLFVGMSSQVKENQDTSGLIQQIFPTSKVKDNYIFYLTSIKKINRAKDIVELKIPRTLQQRFCHSILDHHYDTNSSNWMWRETHGITLSGSKMPLSTVGYVGATPKMYFMEHIRWKQNINNKTYVRRYQITSDFSFFQIHDLPVYLGMSGGAILSKNSLIGIISNTIPLQDITFAIPFYDVINFIEEDDEKNEYSNISFLDNSNNIYASNIINTNNLTATSLKQNENVGDNVPAIGKPVDHLFLREKMNGNILQVADTKFVNTSYFDNRYKNDFFAPFRLPKNEPIFTKEMMKLTNYNKDIIPVFHGIYNNISIDQIRDEHLQKGRIYILKKTPNHPFGWGKRGYEGTTLKLDIDALKNHIGFKFTRTHTMAKSNSINKIIDQALEDINNSLFIMKPSENFADIQLFKSTYQEQEFSLMNMFTSFFKKDEINSSQPKFNQYCETNNEIKLICKSNKIEFGLSIDNQSDKIIDYRFTYVVSDKIVIYIFGKAIPVLMPARNGNKATYHFIIRRSIW